MVVARIQGFKGGGWANERGEGGKPFLLIPLNRENVPAPFAKLTSTELLFRFYFLRCNEPPKAAVVSLSLLYIILALGPRSLQAIHAEENLPLIN